MDMAWNRNRRCVDRGCRCHTWTNPKLSPSTKSASKHQKERTSVPSQQPSEIVETKRRLGFEQPWFDDWRKQVRQRSAEDQIEAVRDKLKELNPGFDGILTPVNDDGRVISLKFSDRTKSTDVSPVRGLARLKTLICTGTWDGLSAHGILR